ncbi:TetR/AcrR family transcriptional regulator [Paenibacillus sacheonensis]|uniref:TetR family transcriptional regulator n=1 Tax=Paenibacillus sacheonensis TaxID=742054 RepID=A0A7X4YSN7_9BACL|nr:TetR/AcrR family transcriptional regulator [Paenibacillus sacheonensis]MBM7569218.1 AcrR family transcriptional regulator [Paenibacillus sacheonensis]NBC71770.1 TetR family transcriptional regulator [Paenibacillus sacheonensis]
MQQRNERKDAARHRELILDTASQLFHERGVEGVSMHQIAKSAGVGQGTLYRRYASKAELCMELMADSFQRFTSGIDHYLASSAGSPVRERLEGFVARLIEYMASEIEWLSAIKPTVTCAEERIGLYQSEPFVYVVGKLKGLLDEAVQSGDARTEDTEFSAFAAAATFDAGMFFYLTKERGFTVEQIKAKYVGHFSGLLLN